MKLLRFAAFAAFLAACAHAEAPADEGPTPPPPGAFACVGAFQQGGVAVCKGEPGAEVRVDGVARGFADGAGIFVIGFDRDSGAEAVVEVRTIAGARYEQTYTVEKRSFSIQRVDGLPPQTVTPTDPAVLKKIEADNVLKAKARESRAAMTGFLDGFAWPVKGRISGAWGNQRVLNGEPRPPHYGVDIAAPTGTAIAAPAAAIVALAQPGMHFEGGLVVLDHGQGLLSYYLHMSRIDVKAGDVVAQGQAVGAVGATGRATGPHLCWRMRWRDRNLDPSLAIDGLAAAKAAFAPMMAAR
jgi:murein DD-endopeptidase MepM/ murein hydrolase activator NlpD